MLHFTSDQWVQWLGVYFWPMLRILALITTAPIFSEKSIPKRVKVGLGIIITIIVAPSLPPVDIPIFSANAVWVALQQVMIGVAVGFTMQLAFAAVRTAGELIGLQMGLSFATFVDPGSHLNMPVLARIIDLLAMLLFLSFNGHLWLISMLVDTFHTLPIGENPVNSNAFRAHPRGGADLPQRPDAGVADYHPAPDRQPGIRSVEPHGTAALHLCDRFSADVDGRNFINVITDAPYRPLL